MATYTDNIFNLSCPYDNEYQGTASRYLFVCSAGLLRSPTAANVAVEMGYNARSCGSHSYALIPLSTNLISWAHKIFFLNEENFYEAKETFEAEPITDCLLRDKAVIWDVEDQHNFNSPTLKAEVRRLLS
jgi:predicted protein tyrosine phosphatase